MRIPDELVDRIKQTADIVDVVGDFVSLKRRGSNYQACCPFHNEKTPSFNVNPVRQIYKCFGCGKAGDAVRFVMDIENIGFTEALRFLAKKYGIEIQEQETTPEELLRQNERESLFIVLNFAKTYYQELLKTHEDGQSIGRSYFRERGFTDPTIDAFELGYSLDQWDALLQTAQQRGYNIDLLEKAGLIITKEDAAGGHRKVFDRFRGRVMFPIHNVSGRVIAFGARILATNKNQSGTPAGTPDRAGSPAAGSPAAPKYLNSPETEVYHKSNVLYGIYQAKQAIRQEEVCYLTEGYTDVISLHQAGIKNVVASSGTSLTIEQIRLIARFTPNVTILYDGDAAGIKAALRGLDMVLEEGLRVSIATFPNGDDPDSFVRRVGAEAFRDYLKANTTDFITFKTNALLRDAGDSPFKQAEVISEIVGSISRIPDPIQRQVFFRKTAQQLQVDEQTIISESNRLIRQQRERQERSGNVSERPRPDQSAPVGNTPQPSTNDINALLDSLQVDGISPAETDVLPVARTTAKSARTSLSYQEEECIRLLLNYGTRELEPGITLCHYMLSELETIQFQTVPYEMMLTRFREAFVRGEILTLAHFLNQQNTEAAIGETLQREAINLTTVRHELSAGWEKHEIFVPSEEEIKILADSAFSNILRIKKMLAEQQMNQIKQRITTAGTPEESDALMLEYMHYKRVDVEIAKLLGTVISG